MNGEGCIESAGQWWWLSVLFLALGTGVLAGLLLVGLGTQTLPSASPEEAPSESTGWRRSLGRVRAVALPVVFAAFVLLQFRRDGWHASLPYLGGAAVLILGIAAVTLTFRPLSAVDDMRTAALESGRPLTEPEVARVTRARWGAGALLLGSAVTFAVMLGLWGGSMQECIPTA